MLNEKIIEKIKLNLITLERYGINDLAWYREDALTMIEYIYPIRPLKGNLQTT